MVLMIGPISNKSTCLLLKDTHIHLFLNKLNAEKYRDIDVDNNYMSRNI